MFARIVGARPALFRRAGLAAILLVAFALRVWNLDWDDGTHQHPDERYWSIVTSDISWEGPAGYFSSDSELNPYTDRSTWVYGTLPLFATKAVAGFLADGPFPAGAIVTLADSVGIDLRNDGFDAEGRPARVDAFDDGYNANLVGRLLSAIADTATVGVVYLLGKRLFNRRVGMLAALLSAFTVLQIQYSHFYGAESWATLFVTAAVLASVELVAALRREDRPGEPASNPTTRRVLLVASATGVLLGMAAASKLTALAALVVPALAVVIAVAPSLARMARSLDRWAPPTAAAAAVAVGGLGLVLERPLVEVALVGLLAVPVFGLVTAILVPGSTRADEHEELLEARHRLLVGALAGICVLAATALTFRVLQPYAFDGMISLDSRFVADLEYLEGVNSGGNVPWVIQWIGRTPLLFPLSSAFMWGLGPALGVAVLTGATLAIGQIIWNRQWLLLLPVTLIVTMLGLVSQQFNPLIRYLLPAYPVATVLGGYGLVAVWSQATRLRRERPAASAVARALTVALVVASAAWGLAFVNGVYGGDNPRVVASRWIAENIEPGAALTHQIWDDRLPLNIEGVPAFAYEIVELDLFRPDGAVDPASGQSKVEALLDGLDRADYVVEASNRLYDSIPRFSARYPATTAYYSALFDGSLGFQEVASFSSSPSLFGIRIDDSGAEETFTVYDHPTVTVWTKTDSYSRERAEVLLNPERARTAVDLEPSAASTNALLLEPDRADALARGPTFDETFDGPGFADSAPWLWWLLWLQVAALAVLPWSTRLFSPLADAGYGLTKVVGFGAVGLASWITVSSGLADMGSGVAWFWLAVAASVGLAGWWRDRSRLRSLWMRNRACWVTSELVFLAVFAAALAVRAMNPDLWESYLGGEKPMELADLTAVARSDELPPYDPWFAGGFLNYYYVGWFFLAVPMRALGVVPEVGFQLGIATYAALTAATAFTIAHALVAATRQRWGGLPSPRIPIRAGLFAVLAMVLVGNLGALRQHYSRLAAVNDWHVGGDVPVIGHIVTFVGGTWAWIRGADLPRFDWWAPSRINDANIDITEFPYFTFLFGDLHPHLMDMAFFGLVVALALTYLLARSAGERRRSTLLAALMGVATGVVRVVNTWDLPAAVLLVGGSVIVGWLIDDRGSRDQQEGGIDSPDSSRGVAALIAATGLAVGVTFVAGGSEPSAEVLAVGAAGLVAAIALLLPRGTRERSLGVLGHGALAAAMHILVFRPYAAGNENWETGLQRAQDRSPLDDYLTHWGLFLGLAAALFAALVVDERRRVRAGAEPAGVIPVELRCGRSAHLAIGGAAVAWTVVAVTAVNGAFAIAAGGALVGAGLMAREVARPERDVGRIAALGLVSLGLAIAAGPEVVTVDPDIVRMNTVFKFWLQAWQLLAIGGAFAVWQVGRVLSESVRLREHPFRAPSHSVVQGHRLRPRIWVAAVVVATAAGLAYPLLATKPRLDTRFAEIDLTLDGLAYLQADPVIVRRDGGPDAPETTLALARDLPLIEWLRANVEGRPTVLEWSGPLYDWSSRIATHTGLPTVLGWDWHQTQQRGDFAFMVQERKRSVQSFYTVAEPTLMTDVMRTYGARFVIVGTMEHRFGSPLALAALRDHPALIEVFRSGDDAIYEVDHDALWATRPAATSSNSSASASAG